MDAKDTIAPRIRRALCDLREDGRRFDAKLTQTHVALAELLRGQADIDELEDAVDRLQAFGELVLWYVDTHLKPDLESLRRTSLRTG